MIHLKGSNCDMLSIAIELPILVCVLLQDSTDKSIYRSGNGLVPSGNKPLPEPMLTWSSLIFTIWGIRGQWVYEIEMWSWKINFVWTLRCVIITKIHMITDLSCKHFKYLLLGDFGAKLWAESSWWSLGGKFFMFYYFLDGKAFKASYGLKRTAFRNTVKSLI